MQTGYRLIFQATSLYLPLHLLDLESSRYGPAHTNPALVLSDLSFILHGQSGAERSGLILGSDAEWERREGGGEGGSL